jgi:hypothetical protein
MSGEFMVRNQIHDKGSMIGILSYMQNKGILKIQDEMISFSKTESAKSSIQFLCHLLMPFIDSYWVAMASLT